MVDFTPVPAHAEVKFGNYTVTTPFIQTITISRNRGEVGKASVVVRINSNNVASGDTGGPLVIKLMGTVAFVGVVKKSTAAADGTCAGRIIVSIQGETVLYKLRNQRITRRAKRAGLSPLALITNIQGPRTFTAFDDPPQFYEIDAGSSPISLLTPTINSRELDAIALSSVDTYGPNHPITKIAEKPKETTAAAGGGGSFILHDHTSLDTTGPRAGGPAYAVYSIK